MSCQQEAAVAYGGLVTARGWTLCQAPGLMESWLAGFQGRGDRLGHRV